MFSKHSQRCDWANIDYNSATPVSRRNHSTSSGIFRRWVHWWEAHASPYHPRQYPRCNTSKTTLLPPLATDESREDKEHTCCTCQEIILEVTKDEAGHDAIYCDGDGCKTWYAPPFVRRCEQKETRDTVCLRGPLLLPVLCDGTSKPITLMHIVLLLCAGPSWKSAIELRKFYPAKIKVYLSIYLKPWHCHLARSCESHYRSAEWVTAYSCSKYPQMMSSLQLGPSSSGVQW